MHLEGRHSSQGKPGTEVGRESWARPLFPQQPRFSKVQAWAASSNRHSLDHHVFLVPGPEQESQASLSWKSGCLAPKTPSAQLRALESLTLRLRIQRSAGSPSLLRRQGGVSEQAQDREQRQHRFKSWLQHLLSWTILGISLIASLIICKMGSIIILPLPISQGSGKLAGLIM